MKTFWKLYYRLTLGEDYGKTLSSARVTNTNIIQSTQGKTNHFYDRNGAMVRGWHKPAIRFTKISDKHPLEIKYN